MGYAEWQETFPHAVILCICEFQMYRSHLWRLKRLRRTDRFCQWRETIHGVRFVITALGGVTAPF